MGGVGVAKIQEVLGEAWAAIMAVLDQSGIVALAIQEFPISNERMISKGGDTCVWGGWYQ